MAAAVTLTVAAAVLSACHADGVGTSTKPTATTATTASTDIESQESGPASPIAFGVSVPEGAVQLGPLIRTRSAGLVRAYQPDLIAAKAQERAEELAQSSATPTPSPTTTAPNLKPEDDSFTLLDNPPKPDVFTSYMRIKSSPMPVVRRMLAELSVLLPTAGIITDDLGTYCSSTAAKRITGCKLDVAGMTPAGNQVAVHWSVDPGDVATRTGRAASEDDPVMTLTIAYTGDPRQGQQKGFNESLPDPPSISAPELSGLIWPRMDLSADVTSRLIGAWRVPSTCTLLLSARQPQFAMAYTMKPSDAANAATNYFHTVAPGLHPTKDVISNLNEVILVQQATRKDGARVEATRVISARGTYLAVSLAPR